MMNAGKRNALIAMMASIVFIDLNIFFGDNSLSLLAKWLIVGITSIGQVVAILAVIYAKPSQAAEGVNKLEKSGFGLTAKLYCMLVLAATIIYTIGIWISTPGSSPGFNRELILGIGLALQIVAFLAFAFKKTQEHADERFYANLAKAASSMFVLCIISMLILAGVLIRFGNLGIHGGILYIAIGILVLLFAFAYMLFEKMG